MGIISWIIFGAIAGWLASMIMGTNSQQGCLMNIIVGIVGAFIGGFLVRLITGGAFIFDWDLTSFAVAVVGSVVLLGLSGWLRRRA